MLLCHRFARCVCECLFVCLRVLFEVHVVERFSLHFELYSFLAYLQTRFRNLVGSPQMLAGIRRIGSLCLLFVVLVLFCFVLVHAAYSVTRFLFCVLVSRCLLATALRVYPAVTRLTVYRRP